jgi:hypothetical protein
MFIDALRAIARLGNADWPEVNRETGFLYGS